MSATGPAAKTTNPFKNPSYPQRTHVRERAQWEDLLKSWESRIALAGKQLESSAAGADRAARERTHAQMLGALDQMADAVRRMPGEAGHLYDEDKHRLDLAVAALERIFRSWK